MITIRRILVFTLNCAAGVLVIAFAAKPGSSVDSINPAQKQAPTLTSPSTPTRAPDEEGFIRRWLILEPVAANGLTDSAVRAALGKEPLFIQSMEIPHNGDRISVEGSDLTWHAVDSNRYNVNLYHFAYAMGKPTSNVLFWAATVVDCRYELKNVRLAIGSNAASVWWVNGKEVIGIYGDRQTVIDDGVSKRLTLKKGLNVVRCVVINGGGATDFCARFLDENDAPVKGFLVNLGKAAK